MTRPHHDTDPIEHDPTGMRALLGSLPDPGPMPAGLVARIEAALADEARRGGGPAGRRDPSGAVVPLPRRGASWRVLAAAAAVAGVLGLGGLLVDGFTEGGTQSTLGMARDDSGSDSGAEALRQGGAGTASQLSLLALDPTVRVRVLGTDVDLPPDDLGASVAGLLDGGVADPGAADPGAEDPGIVAPLRSAPGTSAPALTRPAVARACATALGVRPSAEVVVLIARVAGAPAAVVVATDEAGARTAWAVARSCAPGRPGVLAGPAPVP